MPYKRTEEQNRAMALWKKADSKKYRKMILDILIPACRNCGFSDERALAIDHVNGGGSVERKKLGGRYYRYVYEMISSGSAEYQVLCLNCNGIKKIENKEQRNTKHF